MKKLLLLLVIIFTLYILIIFKLPVLADAIGKTFWLENFNSFVLQFKSDVDMVSTDTPTKEELIDTYNKALSWVIDLKNDIVNGVDVTKEKIDSVRSTLSGAEKTYNDIKEQYGDAVEFIEETSQKIEEAKKIIDAVQTVTNSWITQ
jgi:peptidoglycan hydrolase CwlO-like protein